MWPEAGRRVGNSLVPRPLSPPPPRWGIEATLPGESEWPENEATMCVKHFNDRQTDRQTDRQVQGHNQCLILFTHMQQGINNTSGEPPDDQLPHLIIEEDDEAEAEGCTPPLSPVWVQRVSSFHSYTGYNMLPGLTVTIYASEWTSIFWWHASTTSNPLILLSLYISITVCSQLI